MTTQRATACPRCGNRASLEADNAWRPFCSERCKLIDLGEWFAERHVIVGETDADSEREDELSGTDPRQRRQ